MTDTQSSIGVSTAGEKINWRYLNSERVDDPVISALVKEAETIFIDKKHEEVFEINQNELINIYFDAFNKSLKTNQHLKGNKGNFSFTLPVFVIEQVQEKGKSKKPAKPSKKDLILQKIKEDNIKRDIDNFLKLLAINNHMPNSLKNRVEAFLNIIYWALYLISNKKSSINLSFYLDCSISLYRAINDSRVFLSEHIIDESISLLSNLERFIYDTNIGSLFNFISTNLTFISDSFWDKEKPKSIALYQEQKDIISLISNKLNEKFFIFFEMPPANGKTILSAIIAKVIAHKNKEYMTTLQQYKKKTILYICYNTIVRNEVAKLCITHNVDVKYWLAVYKLDAEDGKMKSFLRPYKNCYPEWNKKIVLSKREQKEYDATKWKKFSENIHDQWEFYLNETRMAREKIREIEDFDNADNIPEMIISDLESAYILLKEFPDTFVAYFDEAFASSQLDITSKIMSVLSRAVLVSATLAKPEEIPTVISDFRGRHELIDNSFLYRVKSNRQHISCTFIDHNGDIYAPHNSIESIDSLPDFLRLLDEPLVKRSYSPEVVFEMSNKIDNILPEEFKFRIRFPNFGSLNHESLREYACDILKFISETNNTVLFERIKQKNSKKINDMDINKMLAKSSIFYQNGKTLHVASSNNFNLHVENIAKPFLEGSPKVSNVISTYDKELEILENKLKSIEKNGNKDSEYEKLEVEKQISNLKIKWPSEFILNSKTHASKFDNSQYLNFPNTEIFGNIRDLDILDDTRAKLYLSGIAVYQPEVFSDIKMDLFLRNKDYFKFILSTPSIVYGTNISLSIIDIDSSFFEHSTKNTLYQLIGRAGRKGKSQSATIIFRDPRMLNIIFSQEDINVEAQYIEHNYQRILAMR
jgi:hypothetical protein